MQKHITSLIDGQFPTGKAKSLLLELLQHKINHHKVVKYSNEIRFEKDLEHSEKRIQELTREKQALIDWLNSLDSNANLNINCTIVIEAV